jgi:hypothetical protein
VILILLEATHSITLGAHSHTITVNSTGNAENTVKNIAFNYIVRLCIMAEMSEQSQIVTVYHFSPETRELLETEEATSHLIPVCLPIALNPSL